MGRMECFIGGTANPDEKFSVVLQIGIPRSRGCNVNLSKVELLRNVCGRENREIARVGLRFLAMIPVVFQIPFDFVAAEWWRCGQKIICDEYIERRFMSCVIKSDFHFYRQPYHGLVYKTYSGSEPRAISGDQSFTQCSVCTVQCAPLPNGNPRDQRRSYCKNQAINGFEKLDYQTSPAYNETPRSHQALF